MRWNGKMIAYAVLVVLGVLVPWYFNIQFMQEHPGLSSLGEFVRGSMANPAASSLSMDLSIGGTAFLIWMIGEARRLKMKNSWAYVVIFFTVAFACACPLFLLMRERTLQASQEQAA